MSEAHRRSVLDKVLSTIDAKFMGAEPNTRRMREEHEQEILRTESPEDFEQAVNAMLKLLGTSHTGFFHEKRPRAAGRIAIAATLTKAQTQDGLRWMFQDVHPGGVAAQAGIRSGDVLLKVGDRELVPPEAMPFVLGETYAFTLRRSDRSTTTATLTIPGSKEKQRPIVVPEKVVTASTLPEHMMRSAVDGRHAWSELSEQAASLTQQPAPTVIHFAQFEQPFLRTLAAGVFPLDVVCTRDIARRLLPMRSCNWSCRSGFPMKEPVLARRKAWRDRAQTRPSMRSASASEERRWIMGQRCVVGAPSLTSSAALLNGSFEYRRWRRGMIRKV